MSMRAAIIATSRSIVGHRSPWRAPARSTDPGIASSSGARPAAMSRCIELPSVACAAVELGQRLGRVDVLRSLGAPDGAALLDRGDEVRAQRGRGADLAEQLVVGARGAGERVQAHELRPHHLRFGVEHARAAPPRR